MHEDTEPTPNPKIPDPEMIDKAYAQHDEVQNIIERAIKFLGPNCAMVQFEALGYEVEVRRKDSPRDPAQPNERPSIEQQIRAIREAGQKHADARDANELARHKRRSSMDKNTLDFGDPKTAARVHTLLHTAMALYPAAAQCASVDDAEAAVADAVRAIDFGIVRTRDELLKPEAYYGIAIWAIEADGEAQGTGTAPRPD